MPAGYGLRQRPRDVLDYGIENAIVERDRENRDDDQLCDCVQYRFGKALERRRRRDGPELVADCGVVGKLARAGGAPLEVTRDLPQVAWLEFAIPRSSDHRAYFTAFRHLTVVVAQTNRRERRVEIHPQLS